MNSIKKRGTKKKRKRGLIRQTIFILQTGFIDIRNFNKNTNQLRLNKKRGQTPQASLK